MAKNYIEIEHQYTDEDGWREVVTWVAVRRPFWDTARRDEDFAPRHLNRVFFIQNTVLTRGSVEEINALRKLLDAIEAEYIENAKGDAVS